MPDNEGPEPAPPGYYDDEVVEEVDFDAERREREREFRQLIVEALSRHADELRALHHMHIQLDANAREKIAEIALGALGLWGWGEPCRCTHSAQCYGARMRPAVEPASQCRQFTIGWSDSPRPQGDE